MRTHQVGGPQTPNGKTASGRPLRAAAGAAGAAWGSPTAQLVREWEEPVPTSSAKRRRVQTALFRDDDDATARQASSSAADGGIVRCPLPARHDVWAFIAAMGSWPGRSQERVFMKIFQLP